MALLIGDLLDRARSATPHATAATLAGETRTFAGLHAEATRCADGLRAHGAGRGAMVAWWAEPALTTLAGMLGAARTGAVFAPLNPRFPAAEAAGILTFLDPRLVIADEAHLDAARDWAAGRGVPVVTVDALVRGTTATAADEPARAAPAATANATAPGTPVPPSSAGPHEDDPHIAYLTSGSTGAPKAVLVSHRASWLRAAPGGGTFATGLRGNGGVLCTFPLYHYGGWHYVMEAWLTMTAVHLVPRADPAPIAEAVERHRPTALYCIPAVWDRLLDTAYAGADLTSLRHCDTGTSPVTGDLITRIKARVPGSTTSVLYGSTEAGRMASLADWELAEHPGSVGRPAFPCSLWVDGSGEVRVRTPAVMTGYLRAPEATKEVLRDGVYRSGDLGVLDDEGYLRLTGRVREVIRTGGEFVAPAEVERAIAGHPAVADLAVVGLPDDRWGEIVCAAVVLRPGASVELSALRSHVAGRLAPHKHPRRLAIVDGIPRTPATGQIQRAAVRSRLLAGEP